MVERVHVNDPDRVRTKLEELTERISQAAVLAGRDPGEVELLAATKYVDVADLPVLAAAGVRLVGENRAQDLAAKVAAGRSSIGGELFVWDFIGALQSRKVRMIVPHVRLIHSVASDSALRELERHRGLAKPGLQILIEVNVADEQGKSGIGTGELDSFIERAPIEVAGLMCMPPLADDPEESRPWFAKLRELAEARQLERLSMGTSQDFEVAVQEGATIVRIGTKLYS